jgi:Entner-Doudoroff aldolase
MRKVEGAVVGAGTVLNPRQLEASAAAGAEFIVSPGLTEPLGRAAIASGVPFLPGIATAADLMRGLDLGLSHFKFFPAETSGGIPALKALAGPFGEARFCPTGGITQASAPQWLALDPVLCVGGSWLVPKDPPMNALERPGQRVEHARGDVRHAGQDEEIADLDPRRARHAVGDQLGALGHPRHPQPRLGEPAAVA